MTKIEVFDPQPQALHESQAAAIEQPGHQLVCARQVAEDAVHLVFGQHRSPSLEEARMMRSSRASGFWVS